MTNSQLWTLIHYSPKRIKDDIGWIILYLCIEGVNNLVKPQIFVRCYLHTREDGSLNVLMRLKVLWNTHCIVHLPANDSQTRRLVLWCDMLESTHHHENTEWGNVFWKNCFHPSSRAPETLRIHNKECWNCSGGSQWRSTISSHPTENRPTSVHTVVTQH